MPNHARRLSASLLSATLLLGAAACSSDDSSGGGDGGSEGASGADCSARNVVCTSTRMVLEGPLIGIHAAL